MNPLMLREDYPLKEMGHPLEILIEECAEVIQAVMKIRRFGLEGTEGYNNPNPREVLVQEIADLIVALGIFGAELGITDKSELTAAVDKKLDKLKTLFGYDELGELLSP